MEISRKRSFRPPLKETSANIPSPNKRQKKLERKLDGNESNIDVVKPILKPDRTNRNRLVGEELQQWRNSWRKIMKNSIAYFDTQGIEQSNLTHQLDQKRAFKALKHVGTEVTPFYDKSVSIIISRRPYNASHVYNANDIFHDASHLRIKVWNYDKVFRFFKNLGINDFDNLKSTQTIVPNHDGDLYNLLREEKIFGSTDKDPNAKREDLHYLSRNYLYVYDLSQNFRPIAVREWNEDEVPVLHLTLDGKCPFLQDSENTERKINRRWKKFEETESYRELLRKTAYTMICNIKNKRNSLYYNTSSSTIISDDNNTISQANSNVQSGKLTEDQEDQFDNEQIYKVPKPNLLRNSSCFPTNNSNTKYYDVAASGFNGESNAIQFSIDSGSMGLAGGNGLGPTMSQVPSKNINNLKRRIFIKKKKQSEELLQKQGEDPKRETKSGYCENCRVKYDHFDDHILTNRHRKFALDDNNFKDIDRLINTLNDSKSFGFITSDGDYSEH